MKKLLLPVFAALITISGFSQNVGIGTTTPTDQLHTTGTVRFEKLAAKPQAPVFADSLGRLFTNQDFLNVNAYAIPDNSCTGVTSVILVNGLSNSISSSGIEVKINIQHTFDADLRIYLVAPNLQVLNLARAIGGGGDNYTNTIFTDNAPASIITGSAPFTGRYQPQADNTPSCGGITPVVSTFAQFGGGSINPNGQWILKVFDSANLDIGSLLNWTISFNGNINTGVKTAFNAYNAASYSIPSGLVTQALFGAKDYDLDNSFNTSSNSFTVQQPGVYHFGGTIFWNTSGTTTSLTASIMVNGVMRRRFYADVNSGSFYQQHIDADIYLSSSDVVTLEIFQNSGFSMTVLGSNLFTNWSVFKVN